MSISVSRRGLLKASGVALAAAAVGGVTGCGPTGGAPKGNASDSAALKLPTYKEFTGVSPDLAGNSEGLQGAFLKFPESFEASTTGAPLTKTATGLTETFAVPSPAMAKNPFWQRLNKKLGADLDLIIGTDPAYPETFATILASNDLPDMMWVPPNQGIPNVGQMLEAKFTDLTPYLSGDAVLEYPNLAALKPDSWKTAVVNGKIWGAPIPSTPFGQVMFGNPKVWEKVGGIQCETAEEFLQKCKELSTGNNYALEPAYANVLHMVGEWFGVPNRWAVKADRTLVRTYETEQYKAALEFTAKLFAANVMHPDANMADSRPQVAQGKIGAFVSVGPAGVGELRSFDDSIQAEPLVPFGWDGKAKPIYDMGYGTVGFTPFKQAEEAKIKELLALINWLSAPFGTQEWVDKNFGTEGEDWERKDGDAALAPEAKANAEGLVSGLVIMSNCESVLYAPGHSEDSQRSYDLEKALLPMAMQIPTKGTYSDTDAKKGTKINTELGDTVTDVVAGRASMTDFDTALKRWQEGGGNEMREEYQAALSEDVPVTPGF